MISVEELKTFLERSADFQSIEQQLETFTKPQKATLKRNIGTIPASVTETDGPIVYIYQSQSLSSVNLDHIVDTLKFEGIETLEEFETAFKAVKDRLFTFITAVLKTVTSGANVSQYMTTLTYLPVLVAAHKGKSKEYLIEYMHQNIPLSNLMQPIALSLILDRFTPYNIN